MYWFRTLFSYGAGYLASQKLFQKKSKQGRLRIWNFQGYQRNSMWNFQELIKNEVEFTEVTKKKSCGISRGLGFWSWSSQGCNTILWIFQGWSFDLSEISCGKVRKQKIPGGGSKKYVLNPPSSFCFLEQPYLGGYGFILMNLSLMK